MVCVDLNRLGADAPNMLWVPRFPLSTETCESCGCVSCVPAGVSFPGQLKVHTYHVHVGDLLHKLPCPLPGGRDLLLLRLPAKGGELGRKVHKPGPGRVQDLVGPRVIHPTMLRHVGRALQNRSNDPFFFRGSFLAKKWVRDFTVIARDFTVIRCHFTVISRDFTVNGFQQIFQNHATKS